MPGITCKKYLPDTKASEDPFVIKHMHQVTSPQSSNHFLSVHTTPYIDHASKLPSKASTATERNAITRSISPCFSTISDTKTFYSAIEVADIYNSEGVSSTVTELEFQTPDSDISMERRWKVTEEPKTNDLVRRQQSIMQDNTVTPERPNPRHPKERSSSSRDSSLSKRATCSVSQSTENGSSSSNRRSSKHRQRRIPKDHSQKPGGSSYRSSYSAMSPQRHQDLLSLHKNSCRLFRSPESVRSSNDHAKPPLKRADSSHQEGRRDQQDGKSHIFPYPALNSHMRSYSTPAKNLANSTTAKSKAHSSLLHSYGIYLPHSIEPGSEIERQEYPSRAGSIDDRSIEESQTSDTQYHFHDKPSSIHKPLPSTVIDWTSPSTRKREYEKIDRSRRGIRGLWHRFAPQAFQLGDRRTPFFEEGKCGTGVYGGSVRRFRMDFSDD